MRLVAAAALVLATATSLLAADPPEPAPPPSPASSSPARKPCEELKAEIAAKLDAKGVKNYTLDIVPNDKAAEMTEGEIVGSCDGGTNKIVYTKAN